MRAALAWLAFALLALSASAQDGTPPAPLPPLPAGHQLAWQALERSALFRIDPSRLPADREMEYRVEQWASVAHAAGFDGVVFVLPESWGDDLAHRLADACRDEQLRFGLQLSRPLQGTRPATFEGFGRLYEIRPAAADDLFLRISDEVAIDAQPQAVIVGSDVRLLRADGGLPGGTDWCLAGEERPVRAMGREDGTRWMPLEVEAQLRPRGGPEPSLAALEDLWFASVGLNANLLLDVPVRGDGRVADEDAALLRAWNERLEATFSRDQAAGAAVVATSVRPGEDFAPWKAADDDPESYWAAADGDRSATLELDFPSPRSFDRVWLAEPIALGQRVRAFALDAWRFGPTGEGHWQELASGTTIGARRVLRVAGVQTERLRLRILDARACPAIATLSLHAAPPRVEILTPGEGFLERKRVALHPSLPGAEVRYTLDGSEPTAESALYGEPIELTSDVTLRARAFLGARAGLELTEREYRCYERAELRPGVEFFRAPDTGVRFEYHEDVGAELASLALDRPASVGEARELDLGLLEREQDVGLVFEGFLKAPKEGVYTFWLEGGDARRLRVHEDALVEGRGADGVGQGELPLAGGWHPFRLEWLHLSGEPRLRLEWSGPGFARRPVVYSDLFR